MEQAGVAAKTFLVERYPTTEPAKARTRTATGASAMRIQEVVPLKTKDKGTLLGYVARLRRRDTFYCRRMTTPRRSNSIVMTALLKNCRQVSEL